MTKSEFMRELTSLLSKIPEDERNDALQYYEDYFADAGIIDEMLVPNSIGTPQQVADKIIGEAIYGKSPEHMTDELKDVPEETCNNKEKTYYNNQKEKSYSNKNVYNNENSRKSDDNTKLILILLIAIVTFPVWSGVVVGIAGLFFGILAGLFGMVIGFGVGGIALIVTAFLASTLASGMLLAGIGMLLLALAIVFAALLAMYCGKFLPWLVRETVDLVKKLLGKKECV